MEETLPKMLEAIANTHPDIAAQYSKNEQEDFSPVSYHELYDIAFDFAAGITQIGIKRYDNVAIISDNRKEWLQADFGLMFIGAIDVPRGCDATKTDLEYILSFVGCKVVIAENVTQVKKILSLKDSLPNLDTFIVFDEIDNTTLFEVKEKGITLYNYSDLLKKGHSYNAVYPDKIKAEIALGNGDDTIAIIFTSGTTGVPKGVMLSHKNFIAQLEDLKVRIYMKAGERALCVLPVWHVFERLCEYVILSQAAALCYSKPVASILLQDFRKTNPHLIPAVPRIFEALYEGIYRAMRKTGGITNIIFLFFIGIAKLHSRIERALFRQKARYSYDGIQFLWVVLFLPYLLLFPIKILGNILVFSKIKAKLGKCFRAGVSGGGALPHIVDEFFWAVGIKVVEGYGLTETAPVISVRYISHPIFGTVGTALKGVEVRIVDDNGKSLSTGQRGVLEVRGPTVCKGYYKRDDLTQKAIDKDGWFNTGDIAMFTINKEIVLTGRLKDTIVLRGGENIEPAPIELKLSESRYIAQAIVVGQDQKYLGALVLANETELISYAHDNNIAYSSYKELCQKHSIKKLYEQQIASLVCAKTGFKMYEKIVKFVILTEPFEVGKELSAKQEVMRYKIPKIYSKQLKSMFK